MRFWQTGLGWNNVQDAGTSIGQDPEVGPISASLPPYHWMSISSFYKVKIFLKEYPPPSHCPDASFHSPHPLWSSSLHRHLTWLSVFLAFSLSSPSMGWGAGGMESPHKSRPMCVFATVATQPTGQRTHWLLHCQCFELFVSSCRGQRDWNSLKKNLEFCPTPSTS